MPLYNYKCHKCGYSFELVHTVDCRYEPTLSVCPRCKEYTVKKDINTVSFKINGYNEKNGYSKKD